MNDDEFWLLFLLIVVATSIGALALNVYLWDF